MSWTGETFFCGQIHEHDPARYKLGDTGRKKLEYLNVSYSHTLKTKIGCQLNVSQQRANTRARLSKKYFKTFIYF